jgi:hypothetical protein
VLPPLFHFSLELSVVYFGGDGDHALQVPGAFPCDYVILERALKAPLELDR